ncbi:MAG: peptidylprolyl isomerase [Butyrivibrio sp.]|nr:peptidylprolyl isomerase [Butyrivibrio sp.]
MKKILSFLLMTIFLTGCSLSDNTKIVFTTGFGSDEVFRIEDSSCSLSEVMVYLINIQNEYEGALGSEILSVQIDEDTTIEDRLKEKALSEIAQIKTMVLLAEINGVALDESESAQASKAGEEYYESLNGEEIEAMNNISIETVTNLYAEYALANKVYEYIIKDINPEISDDEARTITVEQILIKTYSIDEDGNCRKFDASEKAEAYSTAKDILSQIKDGVSFENLMDSYNEADESIISFGKGEKESVYETEAFNLGTDEVSNIIETEDGYYILKCISTFNKEETEANKLKIVEKRRSQVFNEHYDEFASNISRDINMNLWNSVALVKNENVTTNSFFDIYEKYFE